MEQQISELSHSVTVLEALKDKYSDANCTLNEFEHIQLTSKQREGLRASGPGQFPDRGCRTIALDGCGITNAGNAGEIAEIFPIVSELDLTNNHIRDWSEIFKIIGQLKKLRFLNLCGNQLENSSYSSMLHLNNVETRVFDSLTELVLNNTKVSMRTVQQFLKLLPSVEELHLSLNGYCSVPECEEFFESVKRLHFNRNAIKQWQEVEKLGKMFPRLQSLIIMENPLGNVQRENKDSTFVSLEALCLTNTLLSKWEDVDAVRNFISLKQVKLIGIPLVSKLSEDKARRLLVARLPNIQCLNGTRVMSQERENAERNFIRQYHDKEDPPERYYELVAVHGKLGKLADVNLGPVDCANVIMHITGQAPRLETISTVQTVGAFRKHMSQMLHVPVGKFLLFYRDTEVDYPTEKMAYNTQKLSSYGVKDGDEIYIDILD